MNTQTAIANITTPASKYRTEATIQVVTGYTEKGAAIFGFRKIPVVNGRPVNPDARYLEFSKKSYRLRSQAGILA